MPFLTPIIILSSVSLVLGILLVLADTFLADYGECKLVINEEKEYTIRGGSTILFDNVHKALKHSRMNLLGTGVGCFA